jgi:hypothetical protein
VADLVRSAGTAFIERNRQWICWTHIKVLLAIARCHTAALKPNGWLAHFATNGRDRSVKLLKRDQQLRSVSLSYSVALQALELKSSPRGRRGLDASTDRGFKKRSGEVFLLDIRSHRMSAMRRCYNSDGLGCSSGACRVHMSSRIRIAVSGPPRLRPGKLRCRRHERYNPRRK